MGPLDSVTTVTSLTELAISLSRTFLTALNPLTTCRSGLFKCSDPIDTPHNSDGSILADVEASSRKPKDVITAEEFVEVCKDTLTLTSEEMMSELLSRLDHWGLEARNRSSHVIGRNEDGEQVLVRSDLSDRLSTQCSSKSSSSSDENEDDTYEKFEHKEATPRFAPRSFGLKKGKTMPNMLTQPSIKIHQSRSM